MTHKPAMLITMGEPAGIGPELALMVWTKRNQAGLPAFAIVGDPAHLQQVSEKLELGVPIETIAPDQIGQIPENVLPVIPVELALPVQFGNPDTANARAVIKSIELAVDLVRRGLASAIVTCPIQKSVLAKSGFAYPGHTEFLAALAANWPETDGPPPRPVMMLASESMRIVPATIHIPLADVSGALSVEMLVETGQIVAKDLARWFGIEKPRLRFCGLNPHAGESGKMGTEEDEIISPAVAKLQEKGIQAEGPFAADTMFHAGMREQYDVAIAMYHDQALIPIKTIAFDQAVNVTLGLPFIRTSPDHGTALAIAGTGTASCTSLIAAIKMAHAMILARAK